MVMNNNKKAFGVVQSSEENKDYTGVSTETAVVNVNNTTRQISVDVNFRGMLGTSEGTAYPGYLGAQLSEVAYEALSSVSIESERAKTAEEKISQRLEDVLWISNASDADMQGKISQIDRSYASKEYVNQQLIEFNKLHKLIVEEIDLVNNKIKVDGEYQDPQYNLIYLVKEASSQEETYNQYTLIDDVLTFIGSSKIDLSDYATITYVDNALAEFDLSEYATIEHVDEIVSDINTEFAKKSEIPDVSDFLNEIPPEYITEAELEEKQYLTQSSADTIYASKTYVQTELSKIGTLSKEIVDSIDIDNNLVVIEGVPSTPNSDVIYLVETVTPGVYDQYTLINGSLTYIGTTNVELDGYATVEYVDEQIETAISNFNNILFNIEFIDGGTSARL